MTQATALKILKSGLNVFLTGEPGAGKSYVINLLTEMLREKNIRYAVTASTEIAATHINGTTIHSWSGIGIKDDITDKDIEAIMRKEHIVNRIMNTKVLIIDEISMLNAKTLDSAERVIRTIRTSLPEEFMQEELPWGGMQVIFVGDFYQLPPVSKNTKALFCFHADSWKNSNPVTCYLTEQHRQSDKKFLDILKRMRDGASTKEDRDTLLLKKGKDKPGTRLFTHNKDVDIVNDEMLSKIDKKEHDFHMTSWGNEFLVATLKKNCLSPEKLVLKEGALVMFTRNNFEAGYVNGSLGTVVEFHQGYEPIVELKDGRRVYVEKAEWSVGEGLSKTAAITQYPLKLAWAVTVHKSQGMSLDSARIDLSACFEFGQGYVAISRVCSLDGLYIKDMNPRAMMMHPDVVEQDKVFRASSDLMEEKFN